MGVDGKLMMPADERAPDWTACEAHPFEAGTGTCAGCRRRFCASCLVFPHGPRHHPFCIPCALTAAGVRRTAARPRLAGARGLSRLPGVGSNGTVRLAVGLVLAGGTGLAGVHIVNALG